MQPTKQKNLPPTPKIQTDPLPTVYYSRLDWVCEDRSRPLVIEGQPARCPQWDGVEHPGPNGVPHYRGPNLDKP